MTEHTISLAKLFVACWKDADLKARFMADPTEVLAEYGMEVPEGIEVNVVENSDNTVFITFPKAPSNHIELSDEELIIAAGGTFSDPSTLVPIFPHWTKGVYFNCNEPSAST